jgi:hypothetical protein
MKYMQQGMLKGFEFGIEAEAGCSRCHLRYKSEVRRAGASGGDRIAMNFPGWYKPMY